MLQVPLAPMRAVPSTVVPSAANKVMVSPGVPVPLMAGLSLLVMPSPSTPLSLPVFTANAAVKLPANGAVVSSVTATGTGALMLPTESVTLTFNALRPSTK